LTQSSSASQGQAVGAGMQETLQGFTTGVPELQQAQQLRDTQARGGFVGTETGETPSFIGATEGGAAGATQQRRTGGRAAGTAGRRGMQPSQGRGLVIRPTLRVGFAYTPTVSPAIGQNAHECLQRIPEFGKNSSIRARVEKNVVVLEGTVASRHESALAMQMVALEPGVVKVDNRLTVVAPK